MAVLFDVQSESSQDLRGFPVSTNTAAILRARNASFAAHTVIHYYYCEEPDENGTIKSLWSYGNGTADGCYGLVSVFNVTGPSMVFRLRLTANAGGSVSNVIDVAMSPAFTARGSIYMVAVTATGDTSSATYNMRVYRDGVLVGTGTNSATPVQTLATLFNFTADNVAVARGTFQNARGVHTHWLVSGALSNAQIDALALLPFVGPHINHAAAVLYSPASYVVEGTTAGAGVRPEVLVTTSNTCTIDVNAASNPTLLLVARNPATVTGSIRWVDPFAHSGVRAPAPFSTLSGAPSGWTVGTPFLSSASSQLQTLWAAWNTGTPTTRQRVACVANSRISFPTTARVSQPRALMSVTGRAWSGNYVDYDWFTEMFEVARGRHNFQPPLNTTNGGAWGFDCQVNAPLTTGTACVDLSDTTASRFGTGSRVAGPSSPTYHGPGDPIRVPASATYRLLAGPERGLLTSDEIQVLVDILNYPNSSSLTVRREAAQHNQGGADVLSASNESGMPTLGTGMTAATFSGYSTSTNVFSGVSTVADAQVGDMLEVCDSSGNSIADVELAVITAITSNTITVDGKFKIGSTIAGTPANYRLKWCAPGIHRVTVTHAASVANANWRGLKVTSGASGGGLIVLGFGVSNRSRPGPEIVPIGWSGRGWRDQYQQMSHVVSARDGKTMAQRLFELLAPDLVLFSVADQGNPTVASFPDYINAYVDYIRLGAPQAEIIMAGDCAHSAAETVTGLSDAATSYNNHQAAMREVAASRGLTYLTLVNDDSSERIGSVQAQYAEGMLLDGTAHPYRGIWRGWLRQIGRLMSEGYTAAARDASRSRARRVVRT